MKKIKKTGLLLLAILIALMILLHVRFPAQTNLGAL